MDKEAIVKHTRPWQPVLMFFARTQKEHRWKSLQYRFRQRQREAWCKGLRKGCQCLVNKIVFDEEAILCLC
jgi:hypothetical protein